LSRSISNLGSSFGTAVVGSILVTTVLPETQTYGFALVAIILVSIIGLVAAILIPRGKEEKGGEKPEISEEVT
ncbi:MAG: MFS transporter, partial [Candidatus Saccharibacteria bacterium]